MAVAQVTCSLHTCFKTNPSFSPSTTTTSVITLATTPFASGSPLSISWSSGQREVAYKARSVSVRCEQSTKGNGPDVWLGRVAMLGFAVGITVEVATGKGLLENFGLITPLPTAALAVTGLVGVLTAIFIFQSASEN